MELYSATLLHSSPLQN